MDLVWDRPEWLFALWLLLPLAGVAWWCDRRRRSRQARYADAPMRARLLPARSRWRSGVRASCVGLGLAALLVALAGPRWGLYFEDVERRGRDVMVLLDVSRSMQSQDLAPSRLARAQADILDLLDHVGGDRVGLIAFAGKALVLCPLTMDHGFFRLVLDQAGPDSVPRGGTAIGDAIRLGLDTMERAADRDQALLLITDGEDHDSFAEDAAARASDRDVKVFTVGLGDPDEGARVPVTTDAGERAFLKHEGQEVWSRMDESLLRTLALTTGGAYIPARTFDYDLGEVYETHLSGLASGTLQTERRERHHARFQWFLAIALALFAVEMLVRPHAKRTPPRTPQSARPATAALAALLPCMPMQDAPPPSDPRDAVEAGIQALRGGSASEALALFDAAAEAAPNDPTIAYNRGVAHHAAATFPDAQSAYLEAVDTRNPELVTRSRYNLGRLASDEARAVFGDTPEAATKSVREEGLKHLERAIRHFRRVLDDDPGHDDARHNLELIRLWIKHMEQVWKERDEAQEDAPEPEPDPAQRLEALLADTEAMRDALDARLQDEASLAAFATEHVEAADESEALRDLFLEQIEAQRPQMEQMLDASNVSDEERAQALASLDQSADAVRESFDSASEALRDAARRLETNDEPGRAAEGQTAAVARLFPLWLGVAPFPNRIQVALQRQEQILAVLDEAGVPPPETQEASATDGDPATPDDVAGETENAPPSTATDNDDESPQDAADAPSAEPSLDVGTQLRAVERQTTVAMIGQTLPDAGARMLEQMDAMEQAQAAQATQQGAPGAAGAPAGAAGGPSPEERAALEATVALATESAPAIEAQSMDAATHLQEGALIAARPPAEEVARLLRELLDALPEPPPSDQSSPSDDSNDDESEDSDESDESDESESDDESSDSEQDDSSEPQDGEDDPSSGDEPEDPNDPEGDDTSDGEEEGAEPPSEAGEDEAESQDGEPGKEGETLDPEQLQALLRRALEQERELLDRRRALERAVAPPARVGRDW